jgi:hypothetical protein
VALVVKKKVATHVLDKKVPINFIDSVSLSPLYDNYVILHCPQVRPPAPSARVEVEV